MACARPESIFCWPLTRDFLRDECFPEEALLDDFLTLEDEDECAFRAEELVFFAVEDLPVVAVAGSWRALDGAASATVRISAPSALNRSLRIVAPSIMLLTFKPAALQTERRSAKTPINGTGTVIMLHL